MVLTGEDLLSRLLAVPLESVSDHFALRFQAMGTSCLIQYAAPSHARAGAFREEALSWLAMFEARFSRYREDSLISAINRAAGRHEVEVDAEAEGLFQLCDWFHWITRGVFDPTALPLLQLWDYKRTPFRPPAASEIERVRTLLGWSRVQRQPGRIFLPEPGMAIDLGGIGKEYAVDRVALLAQEAGIGDFLVDFGHDVRAAGRPPEGGPWRIGLEDPVDTGRCWSGVALRDRAICTSGDYRRAAEFDGRRYGHIIDPRTGWPVRHDIRSATVIAPTCTEAGILSTAAFILGLPAGLELIDAHHQAEGCLCTETTQHLSRRFHEYQI